MTRPLRPFRSWRLALLGIAALGISGTATAAPVGFVADFRGIVEIQPENAGNWAPAAIDGGVSVGDSIRTEREAFVKVLLVDDTLLEIGGHTEILIDRMIVGDLATTERSILRELNGHVRAYVGEKFGGTTRLEIHTPTAIVGVKGSVMEVWVINQGGRLTTVVANVEGEVWVKSAGTPGASEVMVSEGQSSVIPEGQEPSPSSSGLPFGLTPLAMVTQTVVSNSVTDSILMGGGGVAAGGAGGGAGGMADMVMETTTQTLLAESLDSTNEVGKSVGPEEAFEGFESNIEGVTPSTATDIMAVFNPGALNTPGNSGLGSPVDDITGGFSPGTTETPGNP